MLGRDALAEISAACLVATIEPTPVAEVGQAGFVLGQEPAPDTQLRRNQMVILYVADHPDAVLAPPHEDPPAPRRRRARPQGPSLFDETVGTAPQPQAASPVDPGGDPRPASTGNPFPLRPRRTWPGQPSQSAATSPSDLDPELGEDRQPSPFAVRPAAASPADSDRIAGPDDDLDLSGDPDSYLDAEPDFDDDEIADAEFEPGGSETELLEPDQVSDAAVLEHHRPERAQRGRRRRAQRRFRRLSGGQTIAALLSGVVMLYLAASLLGAHRASPRAPRLPTRTVARTAPAPAPPTTTATPHAAPVRHLKHRAHPRPRPIGHRPAAHRPSPMPASSPSAPTVSPAPSDTASTAPATSPAPAASSTAGESTQARAHHTARASPSSPPSPIGPIAPAPNQP